MSRAEAEYPTPLVPRALKVTKLPLSAVESAGQAAMRAVNELGIDEHADGPTLRAAAARATVGMTAMWMAAGIKRLAPDLVPLVISGDWSLTAAYQEARHRRPMHDRSVAGRRERDERMRQMVAEGYTEHDIAAAVGMTVESVRNVMNTRLHLKTLHRRLGVAGRIEADRVMEALVAAAEPSLDAIGAIAWTELDPARLDDWQRRLTAAIREWTILRNRVRRTPR